MSAINLCPIFFYSHTNSSKGDTRFLSNLYEIKDGVTLSPNVRRYWKRSVDLPEKVPSAEHAYQALKPYENDADAYFILGLACGKDDCEMCKDGTKLRPLSSTNVARFGQGRFSPNKFQKEWLKAHGSCTVEGRKPEISAIGLQWLNENCIHLMMNIIRDKFKHCSHLGRDLMAFYSATQSAFFVENTKNDKIWADGGDGTGTNYLGKLLTIRLHELVTGKDVKELDMEYMNKPNREIIEY